MFSDYDLAKIEEHYKAKFICESSLKNKSGGWVNMPAAFFYTEEAHPDGSNWLALYRDYEGNLIVTDGIIITQDKITGIAADDGDIIFSKYRHDCRWSKDGSVMIDGGREYLRVGGNVNNKTVSMIVTKGELVVE